MHAKRVILLFDVRRANLRFNGRSHDGCFCDGNDLWSTVLTLRVPIIGSVGFYDLTVIHAGAETTLKRFYSEGSQVRLQPANSEMEPIYVPAGQVAIQGRVLGVLRKYK